jgi:hypothetical protein
MKFRAFFIFVVIILFSPYTAYAVSVTFINTPNSIDQSQEFDVDILLNCPGCGDSYLRGVLFPSGTSYFGFTKNNAGEWISSSDDKTKYFKVSSDQIVDSTWSGKLRVKPDPSASSYTGPGEYQFKVGRYTSGGSVTWANEAIAINITGPTPTPTPGPTNTPNPTNTPTNTPAPTATPKPTSTPKVTATPKISPTIPVVSTLQVGDQEYVNAAISGSGTKLLDLNADEELISPSPVVLGEAIESKPSNIGPIALIGTGVLGLGVSLLLLFRRARSPDILS